MERKHCFGVYVLRQQIELYRVEHGSQSRVVFQGTFAQLIASMNARGIASPRPPIPCGPYPKDGAPEIHYTGESIVIAVERFPPSGATDNGGWVYHERTGRIVPDREQRLDD